MKSFKSKEINELILYCKNSKESGGSLTEVFNNTAKKYDKASGSVRNFYYKLVKNKENFYTETEIPPSLKPAFIKEFSRAESKDIITKILIDKTNGKSVRQSVYELALGNDKLALRYQNKYRNALKNDERLINEVVVEVTKKYGKCYNPLSAKTDENLKKIEAEINALLLKIFNSSEKEIQFLKSKVNALTEENAYLKNQIKNL